MYTRLSSVAFIALLFSCFVSCTPAPYKEDTVIFNNYLKTALGLSIPDDSMKFIAVSEWGCGGCIGKTVTRFKDDTTALFIVNKNTYDKYLKPKEVPKVRYVIDTTDRITRLKYHNSIIGIIQTSDGQINKITYVEYMTADSILASIK